MHTVPWLSTPTECSTVSFLENVYFYNFIKNLYDYIRLKGLIKSAA